MSEQRAAVKLTNAELNLLVTLLTEHARDGSYYGNRDQWYARRDRVLQKLLEAKS